MQGDTQDDALLCPRCEAPYDEDDNFCRSCGAALSEARLPAVRDSYDVVPWRSSVPALVRGAAVVAAGTLGEILLRRLVRRAFRPAGVRLPAKPPAKDGAPAVVSEDEEPSADAQVVSETFIFRRVKLRR